jgi:rRNA-processing protein FCF1
MKYRIYLDTHFIDYLLNHRGLIWEGNRSSIDEVEKKDRSQQINEYLTLQDFPLLCWLNNWHIAVGDCVLYELNKIKDRVRKKALIDYAEQLQALAGLRLDDEVDDIINEGLDQQTTEEGQLSQSLLPNHGDVSRLLDKGLALLPSKDRPLVKEAVGLACDIFLTTDSKLLNYGQDAEQYLQLRIRKPTEFLSEEDRRGRIKYFDDVGLFPDLLNYTGLIPNNRF